MYYQLNDVKLFVRQDGEKNPAIIFLHFWGGSSRTWEPVTHLLKADYHCIRIDLRGWGASDKPQTGYDISSMAEDVLLLIQELQLDNYILAGHSMGGKIAQAIAAQKPEALKKLILVAPSPAVPTLLPDEMVKGMLQAYTNIDNIQFTIDHVFEAADLSPDLRRVVIEDMQQHNTASLTAWPGKAMNEDVSAGLSGIQIPTLVVAGGNDKVDPPARLAEEVVARIANARMVVIPDAGHLSMLQAPDKVAALIKEFVREV